MQIEYGTVGKPAATSQAALHVLRILKSAAPAALISAAVTLWCWHATGPGLGLYLGAILLATLYTPALVLAETPRAMWISVAAIVIMFALLLVVSNATADISASEWLRCSIVLAAYVWALAGVVALLSLGRLSALLAAALTVFVGLLWLTWPVWLSHWMTQGLADWLTPANPLMAMNSVLKHLGTWDRAPIAYRALTVLNQDVPYHLPAGIFYAVILHMVIGAPGMILITRRSRKASTTPV